jgi:hypothetical protein
MLSHPRAPLSSDRLDEIRALSSWYHKGDHPCPADPPLSPEGGSFVLAELVPSLLAHIDWLTGELMALERDGAAHAYEQGRRAGWAEAREACALRLDARAAKWRMEGFIEEAGAVEDLVKQLRDLNKDS